MRPLLWLLLAFSPGIRAADDSSSSALVADNYVPPASLPPITVVGSTPLMGSNLNRERVPETTRVLGADDIDRTGIPSPTRALLDNVFRDSWCSAASREIYRYF